MATAGRPAQGVPCVFWPSTPLPQDIVRLAATADGGYLAAACESGQVYIWAARQVSREGSQVRLDPLAVALAGWLGPAHVLDLDFAYAGRGASVVGLRPQQPLLVTLLEGGTLRLLDVSDGRCVASIAAKSLPGGTAGSSRSQRPADGAPPRQRLLRVLEDGRHAALTGTSFDVVIVDLWSGRAVASASVPGEARLLALAAPRSDPVSSNDRRLPRPGRQATAGAGGKSAANLDFAALSAEKVFVWRWQSPARSAELQYKFPFARAYGRIPESGGVGLLTAADGGLLVLGVAGRVIVLSPSAAIGGEVTLQVLTSVAVPELSGFSLLQGCTSRSFRAADGSEEVEEDRCAETSVEVQAACDGCSDDRSFRRRPRRRGRSWSPRREAGGSESADDGSRELRLVTWTSDGRLALADLRPFSAAARSAAADGASSEQEASVALALTLQPWGHLPSSPSSASSGRGCCCWSLGGTGDAADLIVTACPSASRTALLLRTAPATTPSAPHLAPWLRAARLEETWRPEGELGTLRGPRVVCAASLEADGCAWVALALASAPSDASRGVCDRDRGGVCVASAAGRLRTPRRLVLPGDFTEATCLAALGPRFLVAGDDEGTLCWWSPLDWKLLGSLSPSFRAPVVHLARLWVVGAGGAGAAGTRGGPALRSLLRPDPCCVAAMDALGHCRIIDLSAGAVRCTLQPQGGLELWLDEPICFAYDPVGCWICGATTSKVWVWDSESGVFQRTLSTFPPRGGSEPSDAEPVDPGSKLGAQCSSLACPGFDVFLVAWQGAAEATCAPATRPLQPEGGIGLPGLLGEIMLDGPLWRVPVAFLSLGGHLDFSSQTTQDQAGRATAANAQRESSAAGGTTVEPLEGTEKSSVQETEVAGASVASIVGSEGQRRMAEQLKQLGVDLRSSCFVVGSVGVDGSISLQLPRRRGLAQLSVPPSMRRAIKKPSRRACADMSGTSQLLLESVGCEQGRSAGTDPQAVPTEMATHESVVDAFARIRCPHVGLAYVAGLLRQAEVRGPWLEKLVLPAIRELLQNCPLASLADALASWTRALHIQGGDAQDASRTDIPLCYTAFSSAMDLRDTSVCLLGAVAVAEFRIFEQLCPSSIGELIAERLFALMFGNSANHELKSLCCEVFARGFPRWQRFLHAQLASRRSSANDAAGAADAESAGASRTGLVPPSAGTANGARQQLSEELLESLALRALALYQEPRVASSCLGVLLQIGAADPGALINAMGAAARRLDLGAAYASSALFVLIAFIHKHASKVMPLLPRFAEVVLRCLEPSDPALRRQSLLAVTSALRELVRTFPMVAFHQPNQKIAVGTGEGLVVVYDLRTATKWRILEGHTAAVAALSFSNDGGKLASYSAGDCSIRVWQCSSQGFLGGILGASGRCLRVQPLPPAAPLDGRIARRVAGQPLWRTISLVWTDRSALRLVRESGEVAQLQPE